MRISNIEIQQLLYILEEYALRGYIYVDVDFFPEENRIKVLYSDGKKKLPPPEKNDEDNLNDLIA